MQKEIMPTGMIIVGLALSIYGFTIKRKEGESNKVYRDRTFTPIITGIVLIGLGGYISTNGIPKTLSKRGK